MLNSYIFCVMTTRFSRCTNTSRKIYDFLLTEKILKVHKKIQYVWKSLWSNNKVKTGFMLQMKYEDKVSERQQREKKRVETKAEQRLIASNCRTTRTRTS